MAEVFIPALLRDLTAGVETVSVPGETVRQVVDELEARYPGIKTRLLDGSRLRPGITVAVDGQVSGKGLRHKLEEDSSVNFLPALSGG